MSVAAQLKVIQSTLPSGVELVAVSKTKPVSDILEVYHLGQHQFGENKVQEMLDKYEQLPKDISWHLIGHLQTNKVKYIAPFVHLIHSVDSFKLLKEINKQGEKNGRVIDCLLQIHIATEETKFGLDYGEATDLLEGNEIKDMRFVRIQGLMGMATNTDDEHLVRSEFAGLHTYFSKLKTAHQFLILSMGMTSDYSIAIEEGSTMVRIGSAIFGSR